MGDFLTFLLAAFLVDSAHERRNKNKSVYYDWDEINKRDRERECGNNGNKRESL